MSIDHRIERVTLRIELWCRRFEQRRPYRDERPAPVRTPRAAMSRPLLTKIRTCGSSVWPIVRETCRVRKQMMTRDETGRGKIGWPYRAGFEELKGIYRAT